MPAWRQGQAVGEWRQIGGAALSSAPIAVQTFPDAGSTGPDSKVIAWTGFAIDTRDSSVYSAANGGHMDYAGNEVNRLRLSDNTPTWAEPRASSTLANVRMSATHYADGRPTSRHTYYGTALNQIRGRVMLLGGARFGDGFQLATMDGFNLAANDWDAARTYPDAFSEITQDYAMAVAEHKSTGDIYVFSQWNVLRWSNSSNSWSRRLTGTTLYGHSSASAMDTRRGRVLVVGGTGNDHGVYDVAANSVQNVTFSGAQASAMSGQGHGMVYDAGLDAYLLRKGGAGGTVYRINAETFSVDALPTSGGSQVSESINGVYTRFLYAPMLKGVIYFPTYSGNPWFLRTS